MEIALGEFSAWRFCRDIRQKTERDRHTDRKTDRQTHRQTDRPTYENYGSTWLPLLALYMKGGNRTWRLAPEANQLLV